MNLKQKLNIKLIVITFSIVILGVLSRSLDVPNLTALPAVALFLGAFASNKKLAFGSLLAAMVISDIYYGFHLSAWAVYLSYFLMFTLGGSFPTVMKRLKSKITNKFVSVGVTAGIFSTVSAVLFFIITNFAVWAEGFMPGSTHAIYSTGLEGLITCYAAGLAFVRETGYPVLLGTLLFTIPSFIIMSLFNPSFEASNQLSSSELA